MTVNPGKPGGRERWYIFECYPLGSVTVVFITSSRGTIRPITNKNTSNDITTTIVCSLITLALLYTSTI